MTRTFVLAVSLLVSGCSLSTANSNDSTRAEADKGTGAQPETDQAVQKALALLKAEPKVKDVLYQPNAAVRWSVGIFDDGTNRNGYAEYLCLTLKDAGVDQKGTIVRVVDMAKIAQGGVPGRETSLGSMNCETGQPFDA
jgi:hypothetical protein